MLHECGNRAESKVALGAEVYPQTRPEKEYQLIEKLTKRKAACKIVASRLPALCRGVAKTGYRRGDVTGIGFNPDGVAT